MVGLKRLLGEMQPRGQAASRDGDPSPRRGAALAGVHRLDLSPRRASREPMPTEVEAYFANSPEEFRRNRELLEQLPPDIRRIVTFAGDQRRSSGSPTTSSRPTCACLDRPRGRETLESVMAEEKFHLSYVEHELERRAAGRERRVRHRWRSSRRARASPSSSEMQRRRERRRRWSDCSAAGREPGRSRRTTT